MSYTFNPINEERAELRIDGVIGGDWLTEDPITAKRFAKDLKAIGKNKALDIYINSPGGSVMDGQAIYSQLKRHKASKTVHIDGIAASIASVIAMAGDEVVMPNNALIMIHRASGSTWGNASDMRKTADDLDRVDGTIIAAYQAKTGRDPEELIELMDDETWMTAQEAVALGFADRISDAIEMTACAVDLSKFKRPPDALRAMAATPVLPTTPKEPVMPDDVIAENPAPVADSQPVPEPVAAPVTETVAASDPAQLRAEILAAEQQRRSAIRALIAPALQQRAELRACLDACLDDPAVTPDQAGRKLLAALGQHVEALAAPVALDATTDPVNANAPLADRCKAEWQRDPELRAEFLDEFDRYLAYQQALDNKQIRVFKK